MNTTPIENNNINTCLKMNADESKKWLDIAKKAIHNHDYEKAMRFLTKSIKLHPTTEADGLMNLCKMNMEGKSATNANSSTNQNNSNGPYKRHASQKVDEEDKDKTARNYTTEDVKLWKEILDKSNYYEILGVDKKADDNAIKKAYRKLALKLHPDKNSAPKATDAFKKVSTAYAWLSDTQKRQIYDEHGTEDNFRQQYHQYFHDEDDFDEFDIFDIFMGPQYRYHRQQRRGHNRHPQRRQQHPHQNGNGQQNQNMMQPLYFLLLFMLFSVVMNLSSIVSSGPNFSFNKTETYTHGLETEFHHVQYYVDSQTHNQISNSYRVTQEIESSVERDYYKINSKNWKNAKDTKNHWIRQANYNSKGSFK